MTDEEYIKAAVELADGFWWKEDCVHVLDTPMHYWSDALPQTILDALAAQLVRQVDALDDYMISLYCFSVDVLHKFEEISWSASGPDRTMNTIKAIVGSGVLV